MAKTITISIPSLSGTNWKTTLVGLGTAIGSGAIDYLQSGSVTWRGLVLCIGFAALGYFAEDNSKKQKQTSGAPAADASKPSDGVA